MGNPWLSGVGTSAASKQPDRSVAAISQRKGRQAGFNLGFRLICPNIAVTEGIAAIADASGSGVLEPEARKKSKLFLLSDSLFLLRTFPPISKLEVDHAAVQVLRQGIFISYIRFSRARASPGRCFKEAR